MFHDESEEDDYELTGSALHDMDWFHAKKPGLGLWVFLGNCVIRASPVGSAMRPLTIIPHPRQLSSLVHDTSSPRVVGDY